MLKTDILNTKVEMMMKNYIPDTMFVSDDVFHSLLKEAEWYRAEFNQPYVGNIFGLKVYVDKDLKQGQILMIDSKNRSYYQRFEEFNPSRR